MRRRLSGMLACAAVVVSLLSAGEAAAQSADELASGRQLFADALADEEHQRFADALEKYKRVLKIRDTAPIRYRMGLTLEGLGKINEALEAHAAAVRLAGASANDASIARASTARIEALEPRVAHLSLRAPLSPSGTGAEVQVDGAAVAPEALGDVRLDPGAHVVTATAPGAQPFRAQLTLSDGGRAELPIVLSPVPPDALSRPPPPAPPPAKSSLQTAGIVTGIAGGALLIGGLVVMGLRGGAIGDLKAACPGGNCPLARQADLESTHDRAVTETTVGAALLATGIAAIGVGLVLAVLGRERVTALRWPSLGGPGTFVAGGGNR